MKYEVQIDQVVSEFITVEAEHENDAINKAGDQLYKSNETSFDGMPEYRFSIKQLIDTKELSDEK